jgi:hypothetical protein
MGKKTHARRKDIPFFDNCSSQFAKLKNPAETKQQEGKKLHKAPRKNTAKMQEIASSIEILKKKKMLKFLITKKTEQKNESEKRQQKSASHHGTLYEALLVREAQPFLRAIYFRSISRLNSPVFFE